MPIHDSTKIPEADIKNYGAKYDEDDKDRGKKGRKEFPEYQRDIDITGGQGIPVARQDIDYRPSYQPRYTNTNSNYGSPINMNGVAQASNNIAQGITGIVSGAQNLGTAILVKKMKKDGQNKD